MSHGFKMTRALWLRLGMLNVAPFAGRVFRGSIHSLRVPLDAVGVGQDDPPLRIDDEARALAGG